jgi:hypothetical protein
MLRRGMMEEETRSRGLEVIERKARSQNQLIEDLLDVQPVEPRDVIRAAADVVRPATEAKEVRL